MAGKTVARSSSRGLSPLFGRPFRSLRDEMDEMMNQLSLTPGTEWGNSTLVPSVDLAETENALELKTDVPGLKAEEINVEFTGDRVRISGEQSEEKEEKDKTFHRLERSRRSFFRVIDLPCAINQKEVVAEVKDGVLTITMPKSDNAKSTRVTVKG